MAIINCILKHKIKLLAVLTLLSMFVALFTIYQYYTDREVQINRNRVQLEKQTGDIAEKINYYLQKIEEITLDLSETIATSGNNKTIIETVMKNTMVTNPGIFSVGAAFIPDKFSSYAPFCFRKNNKLRLVDEANTGYINENWYNECIKYKSGWIEPYMGKTTHELIVKCYRPVFRINERTGEKTIIGTVYINQSLNYINNIVKKLDLGKSGYTYMLSKNDRFIFHPIQDYILENLKWDNTGKVKSKSEVNKKYIEFDKTDENAREPLYGKKSIHIAKTIDSSGWSIHTVAFLDGFFDKNILKILPMRIIFSVLLFLLLFGFLMLNVFYVRNRLWKSVILYILSALAAIGSIWYYSCKSADFDFKVDKSSRSAPNTIHDSGSVAFSNMDKYYMITNNSDLEKFKDNQRENSEKNYLGKPIFIPTGIYIQTLKMTEAFEAEVTGYVWQKYDKSISAEIERGIVLPECVDGGEFTEEYRREENNVETIGWKFKAVLRESFDYAKYPFDNKDVWIRLWHKNFDKNVILIPDLSGYTLYNPAVKPGISNSIQLEGFNLESSFFQYYYHNYDITFGIPGYIGMRDFPELYYTVLLKRDFKDPFIKYMLPVIVMFCLLFAILVTVNKDEEGKVRLGRFDFSSLLTTCAGLLFSVILAHIDLRGKFNVSQIMYMEYFYIILYVLIVAVVFNGYFFAMNRNIRFIEYKNNELPKLLFWPIVYTFLIVISLVTFF